MTEETKQVAEMPKRPKTTNAAEMELDKIQAKFEDFERRIEQLTLDRMNQAPKADVEPQTKISGKELKKSTEVYLKPKRTVSAPHKFNERFRDEWTFKKQYIQFIAENKEIIGERIEIWTYPFGGVPCEFWEVPTNKPVWGPRYLAEQISRCTYHRLKMTADVPAGTRSTGVEGIEDYGEFVVDTTINRLDANPVNSNTHVFMGAKNF